MAMTDRHNAKDFGFLLGTIEDYVPQDHLVRKMEETIDWSFIYEKVSSLYSSAGRPSIDPVILFKMVFINYTFGINSMRKTVEEIKVNLAYRWFLGISLDEDVPNYSTWSQNYIRRYGNSSVFEEIFEHILSQALEKGYVDLSVIFGDSTPQKANANKRKATDQEAKVARRIYEEDLLREINEDRSAHHKKPLKKVKTGEFAYNEATGKEEEVTSETKHIKVSTIDPESGLYHKGEKEKCFAYSHQTFCDRNGFVLISSTVPGNVHDSSSFYEPYRLLNERYPEEIAKVVLDAGYNVSPICREIYRNKQIPVLPYSRPKGKKEGIRKIDFSYDEEKDCYICPLGCILEYATTNREGYRQYKCKSCKNCPLKASCTSSAQKTISTHIWEHYRLQADQYRSSEDWKKLYPLRKETIERVFADGKENHGLRYTRLRGLKKNQQQVLIIFACHNLKKMSLWDYRKRRYLSLMEDPSFFFSYFPLLRTENEKSFPPFCLIAEERNDFVNRLKCVSEKRTFLYPISQSYIS